MSPWTYPVSWGGRLFCWVFPLNPYLLIKYYKKKFIVPAKFNRKLRINIFTSASLLFSSPGFSWGWVDACLVYPLSQPWQSSSLQGAEHCLRPHWSQVCCRGHDSDCCHTFPCHTHSHFLQLFLTAELKYKKKRMSFASKCEISFV